MIRGLNGLWSPFGFETVEDRKCIVGIWLNGLWSPFGFETLLVGLLALLQLLG